MDSESLYWRLPIWMQHAACGMEGWRIQRRRYGRGFCALLAEVEQRTHWSAEELFGYRDRQIRDYVRYCAAFVPYYRDWFALSRIDPRDVRAWKICECCQSSARVMCRLRATGSLLKGFRRDIG